MSEPAKETKNKFVEALQNLNINGWVVNGATPTNETEFLETFNKITGVDKSDTSILSNDPKDFGVTWTQIKAEMDKL